jgi:hypothetical protein
MEKREKKMEGKENGRKQKVKVCRAVFQQGCAVKR